MENARQGRAADFTPVRLEADDGAGTFVEAIVAGHDETALLAVAA